MPNLTSFFHSHPYILHTKSHHPTIYQVSKYFPNQGFIFCNPCLYNETNRTISPSSAPGISIATYDAMRILTSNMVPIAPITAPASLLLRFLALSHPHSQRFGQLIQTLTPHSQLPYQEKWNKILPNIDWTNTFKLRRASFIPPKEKDVFLRIQCNTLPTTARLHSKHIPTICDFCDEGTIIPNPPPEPSPSISLPSPPPPPEKIKTLEHLLFTCPSSQFIRSSLLSTLELHLKVKITHPAQIIFPPFINKEGGFPYLLLLTTALRQLWLSRCHRRFESKHKHPNAILHTILHLFLIYM